MDAATKATKQWYVIKTVSGKEKKVREYIEAEMRRNPVVQAHVSQILIPTEKVYKIRGGKKVLEEKPYLSGYVFLEAILEGETVGIIRAIPNVLGYLGGKDGKAVPLRQNEVDRLLGTADKVQEGGEDMPIPFTQGETVKIISGPFNNFSGVIEEISERKKKLTVMVTIFGHKTPVELSFMQVEKEQ